MLEAMSVRELLLSPQFDSLSAPATWGRAGIAFLSGNTVGLVDPATGEVSSLGIPLDLPLDVQHPEPLLVAPFDPQEEALVDEAMSGGLAPWRDFGALLKELRRHLEGDAPDRPERLAWEADGERLAVLSGREVAILTPDGEVLNRFTHSLSRADGLSFAAGGVMIPSVDIEGLSGMVSYFEIGPQGEVDEDKSLAIRADGRLVLSATGHLVVLQLYQGLIWINDPAAPRRNVPTPTTFSPMSLPKMAPTLTGAVLVDLFNNVYVYGADEEPLRSRLPDLDADRYQPQSQETELPVSPDGELLVRLSWNAPPPDEDWDGTTRAEFVHLASGEARSFELEGRAYTPAWEPDGHRVAIATQPGKVYVFSTSS